MNIYKIYYFMVNNDCSVDDIWSPKEDEKYEKSIEW